LPLVTANILQPLIDVFEAVIKFFHNNVGLGWGLSIIALTIVIRALLIPLTLRQFRSMQALQRLQPEIKSLQAKYKDDKQRLNQEMMKFYQENKVNPLGSCLPLVAQFPVFISLFYMLRKDLRQNICPGIQLAAHTGKGLGHVGSGSTVACTAHVAGVDPATAHAGAQAARFLFISDMTNTATGAVLIILIALYIGTQLVSSLLMSATTDRNQRMLMIGLPFVFTVFIIRFPAGLIMYWITTNTWTILQQYIVRKRVGPIRPPALAVAADGAGGGGSAVALRDGEKEKSGGLIGLLRGAGAAGSGVRDGLRDGAASGAEAKRGARDVNGKGSGDKEPVQAKSRPDGKAPPPPPRKRKARSGRRR
jgi:YidC/Oxa1 family membrane protein insertase